MKTVRIITARLYILTTRDMRHDLTATSASDLADQVQQITRSRPAAQLARIAWGDEAADISAAGVRLLATGQVVREVWRTLSPIRGSQPVQTMPEVPATPVLPVVPVQLDGPAAEVEHAAYTPPAVSVQASAQAAAPTRQPPPRREQSLPLGQGDEL